MDFNEFVEENIEIINEIGLNFSKYDSNNYGIRCGCDENRAFIAIGKNYNHDNAKENLINEREYYFPKKYYKYLEIITMKMNNK